MFHKFHLSPIYKKLLLINSVFIIAVSLIVWRVSIQEKRPVVLPIPPEYEVLTSSSTPLSLSIPIINVEANVVSVGKTRGGNMAVPEKYEDTGWYRYGYGPGTAGNSVIAGHLDNGGGKPAVFYDLGKLRIDDRVYVTNEAGEKLEFKVTGMSLYDYKNAPLELIFGPTDKIRLNLITCDGVWLPAEKIYDERLVVFTEFVGIVN